MRKVKGILLLAVIITMFSVATIAYAASVEPELWEEWKSGNAEFECEQLECDADYAYKIDNWSGSMNGDYYSYPFTITISNSDSKSFDWESTLPVCAVIVKAGKGAYVYHYGEEVYSDTGLDAPWGKDISHVTFCLKVPDFVVPETPIGTISSILAMLGAALLLRNRTISIK
jgi:hypothetical protein